MTNTQSNMAKLPERCYLVNPKDGTFNTDAPVVCLVAGVSGYFPIECCASDTAGLVERGNARYGVQPHHIEAMKYGSAFGWHVPAADSDYWRDMNAAAASQQEVR